MSRVSERCCGDKNCDCGPIGEDCAPIVPILEAKKGQIVINTETKVTMQAIEAPPGYIVITEEEYSRLKANQCEESIDSFMGSVDCP